MHLLSWSRIEQIHSPSGELGCRISIHVVIIRVQQHGHLFVVILSFVSVLTASHSVELHLGRLYKVLELQQLVLGEAVLREQIERQHDAHLRDHEPD